MRTRLVTSAVLFLLLPAIYFGPAWAFLLLAIAASVLATRETLLLHVARGTRPVAGAALVAAVLFCVSSFAPEHVPLGLALALSVVLAFGAHAILRPVDDALPDLSATLACMAFPALLVSFQVALRLLPGDGSPRSGAALLLYLYAVVFGNDAAAYFTGRALGRIKLAPGISPGKTVEGFVGGVLGGVALGGLVARALPCGLGLAQSLGYAALLALAAVLGDLSKSLLKRSARVKDSGSLLPGHGGVLDRIDGLLFAGPLLFYLLTARPAGGLE